ncbi:MAG: hypothetical protein ACKVZ0_02075 [Gemmatimonadales bacterium]
MSARLMLAVGPVAVLLAAATESPAPKTTRYRIESKTEQIVDATGVGGPKQEVTVNQVAILSITLSDTAGGKTMHVVIDSVGTDSPQPEAAAMAAKAKGAWIHGFVDGWGRGKIAASSADSNEIVDQLKPTLARFFPVVKPGAKPGDSWVDTMNFDSKSATRAMKSLRISTYTHAGPSTWGGSPAVKVDATTSSSGAGTMENPMAGTMEVESTSNGTESFYLSADGTYLGGEAKQGGDSKIRAAMFPDAIPVKISSAVTVTVLK